jgi:hypothetical protein
MKKLLILSLFFSSLSACKKKEATLNHSRIGTWKLIEVLADPGDGSGTFQPVVSNKTITFDNQLNVTSNGILCDMSIASNAGSAGKYVIADSTIIPFDCPSTTLVTTKYGDTLVLRYSCFEACRAKYMKE